MKSAPPVGPTTDPHTNMIRMLVLVFLCVGLASSAASYNRTTTVISTPAVAVVGHHAVDNHGAADDDDHHHHHRPRRLGKGKSKKINVDDSGDGAITNFWSSPRRSHAGPQEGPRMAFHQALEAHQNPDPATCGTDAAKPLCACHHRLRGSGLFSQLHGRLDCLLQAFVEDCILVDRADLEENLIVNKVYFGCDVRGEGLPSPWECYFQPLSTCTANDVTKSKKGRQIQTFKATENCRVFGAHSKIIKHRFGLSTPLLLRSELLAYLMRPNARLQDSVAKWSQNMQLTTAEDFNSCLAVHVRHTDKRGVPKLSLIHI